MVRLAEIVIPPSPQERWRQGKGTDPMAQTGQVKFFNTEKGFGFIKPDDGGADIFVHISAVQASGLTGLADNQKVSYETEPDRRGKGPKAVNITVTG
ncbi:cold shock protein CSPA [Brucella intermedia LMG 3301]|nr:cold shock protein CSPA [Brucella intermedia LMG 3301]